MAGEDTYDFGECTWYVAHELAWVRGGWGNATDWPAHAAAQGFGITDHPVVGSVVAYAAGGGYSDFGHVAIVEAVWNRFSFQVREMNFVAWDTVDHRTSSMWDVEAFILAPGSGLGGGSQDGGGGPTAVDRVKLEWAGLAQYLNRDIESDLYWLQLLTNRANAL